MRKYSLSCAHCGTNASHDAHDREVGGDGRAGRVQPAPCTRTRKHEAAPQKHRCSHRRGLVRQPAILPTHMPRSHWCPTRNETRLLQYRRPCPSGRQDRQQTLLHVTPYCRVEKQPGKASFTARPKLTLLQQRSAVAPRAPHPRAITARQNLSLESYDRYPSARPLSRKIPTAAREP